MPGELETVEFQLPPELGAAWARRPETRDDVSRAAAGTPIEGCCD